jgi:hypothetical protein
MVGPTQIMSCSGSHLDILKHRKNYDTVRGHPMIIHVQFWVNQDFYF